LSRYRNSAKKIARASLGDLMDWIAAPD